MKRTALLIIFSFLIFQSTYALSNTANTISVFLNTNNLDSNCNSNTLIISKGMNPSNIGNSSVLNFFPLCNYIGKAETKIATYSTVDFSGYSYLLVSNQNNSSIVVKNNCIVSGFGENGSVHIQINDNGTPEPSYSVTCNY